MQHPDHTRVIVTSIRQDGSDGYEDITVAATEMDDGKGNPVFKVSQLWGTPDGPITVGAGCDAGQVVEPWFPTPGGIRYRFFTFLPETKVDGDHEATHLEDASGEGTAGFAEAFDPERPGMHISDSIDFVHILSGAIVLELQGSEIALKAGDVVVTRGGWHNWRNETDQPCTVASVMVGATRTG